MNILRWILFLPLGFAVGILLTWLFTTVITIAFALFSINKDFYLFNLFKTILYPFVLTVSSIYFGYLFSPNKNYKIAKILLIFFLLVSLNDFIYQLLFEDYFKLLRLIGYLLGLFLSYLFLNAKVTPNFRLGIKRETTDFLWLIPAIALIVLGVKIFFIPFEYLQNEYSIKLKLGPELVGSYLCILGLFCLYPVMTNIYRKFKQ